MTAHFGISGYKAILPGEAPDVSFVPPLVRRRLSPLQKLFFALARGTENNRPDSIVFACRDGEDTLSRRITDEFVESHSVSPQRFSSSVYNAAPGLWSVFTRNPAQYTAIAGDDDVIECALLELFSKPLPALFVYAEETGGGYGFAFSIDSVSGRMVEVTAGDAANAPVSFQSFVEFLRGERNELRGRWLSVRYWEMLPM